MRWWAAGLAAGLLAHPSRLPGQQPSPPAAAGCPVVGPVRLDSLLASGRWWHGSLAVRVPAGRGPIPAADALTMGRIAEGLGRWTQLEDVLRRARGGDSLPDLLALAARADERAQRWAAAEAKYRRLLALPAVSAGTRTAASARLGVVLEAQGRYDSAAAVWRRTAQLLPDIADWLALRRADNSPDTALAFAELATMRSPGARRRADMLAAQRRVAAGNLRGALDNYRRLGQPLDVARIEFALGQRRVARARTDSVLFADPTRPVGLLAATLLTEHVDTLTLPELLAVSRAYRARDDLVSAERYARLATRTGRDTSLGAWLELATVLSLRRQPAQALQAVDSAAVRAGRRRATVTAAARVQVLVADGAWDAADTLMRGLARAWPGDTAIARAMLLLANRNRSRGELEAEAGRYDLLLRRFAAAPAGNIARFRLGLMLYAGGLADSARVLLLDAAARDSAQAIGLPAQYWQARVRLEAGDSSAMVDLRRLARDAPVSFYGVRAREYLGDTTSFLVDTPLALPRPGSFAPARARERIRLLASLGFDSDARAEAMGWLGDTTVSVQLLVAAALAAGDAGFARESIWLGEAARRRAGMLPGVARALFPWPLRGVMEAEAAEQCVDPLLLAAIVRQESRFDVRAVSRAGARGISQVMPATAREMATRARIANWDPDLLFVADHNLHLGARYLRERVVRDSFTVVALLASYNAGAQRVNRWKSWPEYNDPDLFAERVAITETRDYVKTVYMSYAWYRQIYGDRTASGPPPPAAAPSLPVP